MGKSKVTLYYEKKLKKRIFLEPPTAQEAFEAVDFLTGIRLLDELDDILKRMNPWLDHYLYDLDWTKVPHWKRHYDTFTNIRKVLRAELGTKEYVQRHLTQLYLEQENPPVYNYGT